MELFNDIKDGRVSPEEALKKIHTEPFKDLGYAKVDHHRGVRQGAAEVIFGKGKTPEQVLGIVDEMAGAGTSDILVTFMSEECAELVGGRHSLEYHPLPRLGMVNVNGKRRKKGSVVVASAGTSDMAVSEEAALTAEFLGSSVTRLYDVGVSGIHRLLAQVDVLAGARAVVAVAGMEGALASVVGGLVSCPVIAVPTSVGYGASFGGVAALLAMLNSCASGVSVVNIDNGFGAGYIANMINQAEGVL